jgi:iron complex transport system substrate-binding protein
MKPVARKTALILFFLATILLSYVVRILIHGKPEGDIVAPQSYNRIISLAPNITETLFALGLGDQVVGVTRYCLFPQEAARKKNVGGLLDVNFEAIASLEPDLIVALPEHGEAKKRFTSHGIKVLTVENKTVKDILDSILAIGAACNVKGTAEEMVRGLEERLNASQKFSAGLSRPRVLVSFTGGIKNAFIAGRNTFYDELIELAGGTNAYQDEKIKFPYVSREGIISLNPDIILNRIPLSQGKGLKAADVLNEWMGLTEVRAVREGRVYVLGNDYVTIPGPRFILLLEDMKKLIHPNVNEQ